MKTWLDISPILLEELRQLYNLPAVLASKPPAVPKLLFVDSLTSILLCDTVPLPPKLMLTGTGGAADLFQSRDSQMGLLVVEAIKQQHIIVVFIKCTCLLVLLISSYSSNGRPFAVHRVGI
jgi:hypothetical protein